MSNDKILMCPPDYFSVEYVINPWMAGHGDDLSLEVARRQWDALRNKLSEFADIVTIRAGPLWLNESGWIQASTVISPVAVMAS